MPTDNIIDEETAGAFEKDGVTVLRGLFADWVETLREGVAWNLANPGPSGRNYQGENGAGRFHSDYCNWQRVPQYEDFIFNSPVARASAALMGSGTVQLFHEHILIKDADADVPTPWHQDQPYYCVECPKTVSFWIPLDDVSRDRSLEFIAGSHLTGQFYQPQFFNGNPLNEGDEMVPVPDVNSDRERFDIRGWAVSPGDAVAFDYRTVHGAPANTSQTDQRRAFSLRLVGEGARFIRHEGRQTSPPFPDVTLAHGAPLEGPEFPVIFPNSSINQPR